MTTGQHRLTTDRINDCQYAMSIQHDSRTGYEGRHFLKRCKRGKTSDDPAQAPQKSVLPDGVHLEPGIETDAISFGSSVTNFDFAITRCAPASRAALRFSVST
jgi:hypothetical protein